MKRILAAMLCAASLACSTSGPSPVESAYGGVTGSLTDGAGDQFIFPTIADASVLSYSGTSCTGPNAESSLAIYLSSQPGVCAALNEHAGIASSEALVISIVGDPGQSGGAAPVIGIGSYDIANGAVDENGNLYGVSLVFAQFDDICGQTDYSALSGTVVISSITDGEVQGTFTANFINTDGTLSGDFNVPACSAPSADHCGTSSGACNR